MSATTFLQIATDYSMYSEFVLGIFGFVGNFLNILVFTRFKLFEQNRAAFYITTESLLNLLYQIITITISILIYFYGDDATNRFEIWCKFRYLLVQSSVIPGFYMICMSAIDQFFSTNYRFYQRQTCTMKLARILIFSIICFWIVHAIVFVLTLQVQPPFGCIISNYVWLQYCTYVFYPILTGILPVVIAAFFSILAFQNVRRIVRRQIPIVRRRLDKQMTTLVLLRVIFFVLFLLPYVAYRIFVINFPVSSTKPMEFAIVRIIQVVTTSSFHMNATVSYISYIFSDFYK